MVLISFDRWVLLINLKFCAIEYITWLLATVAVVSIEITRTLLRGQILLILG